MPSDISDQPGVPIPDPNAPFEEQRLYFLELSKLNSPADRAAAVEFRRRRLIIPTITRCREPFLQQCRQVDARPRHVVVIVSHGIEVIPLLCGVMQAESCLVLHDRTNPGMRELAAETETLMGSLLPDCELHLKPFEQTGRMKHQFREHVDEFAAGRDSGSLAFDMTLGTKLMNYTMSYEIAQSSWLVYVYHTYYARGIPDPGSERIGIWAVMHPFPVEQFFDASIVDDRNCGGVQ